MSWIYRKREAVATRKYIQNTVEFNKNNTMFCIVNLYCGSLFFTASLLLVVSPETDHKNLCLSHMVLNKNSLIYTY